jgi:CRISPR-associated protein Csb1
MSDHKVSLEQFNGWLRDDSDAAALIMRQWLEPVEGKDAVIFPPTYAKPEGTKEEEWTGYNIDRFEDGTSVCQIDSVGSQANRMEPIFKRERYKHLVPRVIIKAGEQEVDLLDAGHRAADAIVRFSPDLGPKLHEGFSAFRKNGDAEPLAKIAPTSIVFGSWDSRATQAKLPRIVRSVIRAYNVREIHRSAQYTTIAGEILEGGDVEVTTKGAKAELGLAHVPSVMRHGGVQALGEIRRDATLNFVALRALGASSPEQTLKLRRYILGLGLVAFTAPQEGFLREGCHLVPIENREATWQVVSHNGNRGELKLSHEEALAYATAAAHAFGVKPSSILGVFNSDLANDVMKLGEQERKALLKQGPLTSESIKVAKANRKKSK